MDVDADDGLVGVGLPEHSVPHGTDEPASLAAVGLAHAVPHRRQAAARAAQMHAPF